MLVKLIGRPVIKHEDVWLEPPRGKTSALLYYLAFKAEPVSRDELLFLLWPDTAEEKARNNLRRLLSSLKPLPYLVDLKIESQTISWIIPSDLLDLRQALEKQDVPNVLQLYEAYLLEDLRLEALAEFTHWLETARDALHKSVKSAVFSFSKMLSHQGRYEQAAEGLEQLYGIDPLDEEVLYPLLENLYLQANSFKAKALFEAFERKLARDLDLKPSQKLIDLFVKFQLVPQNSTQVPHKAIAKPKHNLPKQGTAFIGREKEKKQLSERLAEPHCRVLSIIAPGGFGKTRLAIELAKTQVDTYRDGVCFVSFVAIPSPDLMIYAITEALGLAFFGEADIRKQLLDYLKTKEMLLVLDNLEHLLSGVDLINDVFAYTDGIKLLVTSREPLAIQAEHVFDLQGLSTLNANQDSSSEAISLFLQCAQQRGLKVEGDAKSSYNINDICQKVLGMPLAIELAASWLRALSPEDIAREIGQSIDFLQANSRDLPERHRSMRAVFDYSWQLLSETEKSALRKLAVFSGGFIREAASDIANVSLPTLASLMDKSLLSRNASSRYQRHPLVLQYTEEKLSENQDELSSIVEKHAVYFLNLARQEAVKLDTKGHQDALKILEEELANIRKAWTWAISSKNYQEICNTSHELAVTYDRLSLQGVSDFQVSLDFNETNVEAQKAQAYLG